MAPHSRRSVLRAGAIGLGVLSTGCNGITEIGDQEEEQAAMQPPGSPPLDAGGAWPSYRYDAGNTGANPAGVGVKNGTPYWQLDAGGPATLTNNTLYNTTEKAVTYRDPATAAVETRTRSEYYGSNALPVVSGGRVFVTRSLGRSQGSETICIDADTGKQHWTGPQSEGIVGHPTVYDGTALINIGSREITRPHVRAFDAASGEELWQSNLGHTSYATPAVGNGRVFLGSEGGLHAIDLASGDGAYTVTDELNAPTTPVVYDETVYVHTSDSQLAAVDTADGTIHWRSPMKGRYANSPPVVANGSVFTVTDDGIKALDARDGSSISSNTTVAMPVGLVGEVLYAIGLGPDGNGDADGVGVLFAFDTKHDLNQLWSLTTERVSLGDDWSAPHIYHVLPVDDAVYVSARDGLHGIGPQR